MERTWITESSFNLEKVCRDLLRGYEDVGGGGGGGLAKSLYGCVCVYVCVCVGGALKHW